MQLRPAATSLAWAAAACSLALCAAALALLALPAAAPTAERVSLLRTAAQLLSILTFAAVGAVIATRRPHNPIGWLFCGIGLTGEVQATALGYVRYALFAAPGPLPAVEPIGWLVNLWVVTFELVPLLFLLFPDGRVLSPRWRPLVWLTPPHMVLAFFVVALDLGPTTTQVPLLERLFGTHTGLQLVQIGQNIQGYGMLAAFIAAAACLGLRLRRARGDERAQLKWFAYASLVLAFVMVATTVIFFSPAGSALDPDAPTPPALFLGIPFGLALAGLPVAAGVAILKYRLYDIDLLIRRTLVYGALTAVVISLYTLVVGYLGTLFHTGGSNLGVSLAGTGLVAVLFQPLRERMQRGVSRLLYGEREEPYTVLARLGQRLEATLAPEAVLPTVVQTVREALKLPYTGVALRQEDGSSIAAEAGRPVADPLRLPLVYQGEPVGELLLGPRAPGEAFGPADRRLLEHLAHQASVAVHAVRLAADLRRARERLVSAREEERRRLRRDLHDGLGPRLAAQTLKVGSARVLLTRDPAASDVLLAELEDDIQHALAEVRRLVYALRPPALDDLGLVGALRASVQQYVRGTHGVAAPNGGDTLQVTMEAPEDLPPLPAAVEVAAFRIVHEALTNVVRHAAARRCRVHLWLDGALHLAVADDGVGLAPDRRTGVGLASMRERAEELGGTCMIAPGPEGGTHVRVVLPLSEQGDQTGQLGRAADATGGESAHRAWARSGA